MFYSVHSTLSFFSASVGMHMNLPKMESSQNMSVLRELYSKCNRGYLKGNLDFKGYCQTWVPLFSMLFDVTRNSEVESLLNYGLDDGSLPWAAILSGYKDPAEGKNLWSEFPDQQWKICLSLLDLERNLSDLEFLSLSTFPFFESISIQNLGEKMQSVSTTVGIGNRRNNERDFFVLETDHCLSRSTRVATQERVKITSNGFEHSQETLADIFAENKPPCDYQGIKYMWERVLGMISSVMAVHGHVKNLRIDYNITPATILVSPDRGSGKSFFFNFNTTNGGGCYEADEAKSYAAFHSRNYSKSITFPRIHDAYRIDPRCVGAPERSFDTMSNTEKCSSDDIWSLGCILLEISAFITYGNQGLHEFQKQRRMEIASLHRKLGNLDDAYFHDSHGPLESVRKFVQGIHRNGRRCDDITPRIVDLALNRLLVPQKTRCTAFELFNKVDEAIEISKDV
ncbi:unnamed protein product [Clonostachys byssicola]|uniref:Protein kinase domain-containing protein n=1 Tax=Clonostachys byssicola TaxID=160290 RepID=A0A9N9U0E6_9HYPO|nr:unnamed protein product [Clonostachys byssicola]